MHAGHTASDVNTHIAHKMFSFHTVFVQKFCGHTSTYFNKAPCSICAKTAYVNIHLHKFFTENIEIKVSEIKTIFNSFFPVNVSH